MLERILVPLDTSRFAEQALPHAIGLARRAQAELTLVSVRPSLTLHRRGDLEEKYLARITTQLASELPNSITHRVLTDEVAPYYATLEASRIASVLSGYAAEHGVDLIVLATHGRGGVLRAWLGSVADSLLRHASRPVLLIRPQDETFSSAAGADRGMRHIVIGLDGSTSAEQVIPYAMQLGSVCGARYSLVRVISPAEWDGYEAWSARVAAVGVAPPLFAESVPLPSRRDVAESLERVAARMREQGVSVRTRVLDEFSAGDAIVQYAAVQGADAIALTTTGVSGFQRLLLGSVTNRVVRTSKIPVLVCNVRRVEEVQDETPTEAVAASDTCEEP